MKLFFETAPPRFSFELTFEAPSVLTSSTYSKQYDQNQNQNQTKTYQVPKTVLIQEGGYCFENGSARCGALRHNNTTQQHNNNNNNNNNTTTTTTTTTT